MSIATRKRIVLALFFFSFFPLLLMRAPRLNFADPEVVLDVLLFLGKACGVIGIILLWWQYMLGWRRVVISLIQDWAWVNNIHKWIGKYGMLLVFTHPILLIISDESRRPSLLGLSLATATDQFIFAGKVAIAVLIYIYISSALLRGRLSFRFWKFTHYATYVILPLVLWHSWNIGSDLAIVPGLQWYWQFMFVTFGIVFIARIANQLGVRRPEYKLVDKKQLTSDVQEFVFEPTGKPVAEPQPGQFLYVQDSLWGEAHPYTLVNYDDKTNAIWFGIKASGKYSKKQQSWEPGKLIRLEGPYGVFTREAYTTSRKVVVIAGGIGITPFLEVVERLPAERVMLFYGNRTEKDIAYRDRLEEKLGNNLVHVLSNCTEKPAGMGNCELGFMTAEMLRKYLKDMPDREYFVCGPPAMMTAVLKVLKELGIPDWQVHIEHFSPK